MNDEDYEKFITEHYVEGLQKIMKQNLDYDTFNSICDDPCYSYNEGRSIVVFTCTYTRELSVVDFESVLSTHKKGKPSLRKINQALEHINSLLEEGFYTDDTKEPQR